MPPRRRKKRLPMGWGKDEFILYDRKPEDKRKRRLCRKSRLPHAGGVFKACVKSWAQEESVDMITCGRSWPWTAIPCDNGEPSEVEAVRRELAYLNQAAAEVGRPGIAAWRRRAAFPRWATCRGGARPAAQHGRRHLVALNNELIINRDNLVRAASSAYTGVRNASLSCVMVEGMAGGAPGAAVVMIASMLAANLVCCADYHLCHPIHLRHIATSTPECMWLQSVVCRRSRCAPPTSSSAIFILKAAR